MDVDRLDMVIGAAAFRLVANVDLEVDLPRRLVLLEQIAFFAQSVRKVCRIGGDYELAQPVELMNERSVFALCNARATRERRQDRS